MAKESIPLNENRISHQPIPAETRIPESTGETGGMDEIFDQVAARLYNLASMLVGEGEDSVKLVETALANAEVSVCQDPIKARKSNRRALAAAALGILEERNPGCLAAPQGLEPAGICIEDDDLEAAGVSGEELERMIAGPDRDRVRKWLASLPPALRTIFVLRAVAGFSAAETAALLQSHGGPQAAGWTADAVRQLFRQGLCSLASQLLQASAAR
ncbi:MAG: sigma factor-like helix-turn-helix DNA-binding protein [Terracidiphilus sp.]|jgi:DNA-directed RNA polymerase specialized sigma24 family protein